MIGWRSLHGRCLWRDPARGVAVRSKDGATQENIRGQYWGSSGAAIRMGSEGW